jgi:hypothetical protein
MKLLHLIYLIVREAPPAIVYGRFRLDDRYTVYGVPARILGLTLLSIPLMIAIGVVMVVVRDGERWPEWYLIIHVVHFFGAVILSATLSVLFRKRNRVPAPEDTGRGPVVRKKTRGPANSNPESPS